MAETTDEGALNTLFDTLREAAARDEVSLGHIVDAIGSRGAGPLLVIPALAAISPVAAIPGLPTLFAIVIVIFAAQILFWRQRLWVPDILRNRDVKGKRVENALDKLQPVADALDRVFARRLTWAAEETATRIACATVILLCLAVPPLEVVPGAVVAPMGAIALIGLAMMVRDGVMMLAGLVAAVAAGAASIGVLV